MILEEFLKYPAGKGAIMPGKDELLKVLNVRFDFMLKKRGGIDIKVYTNKDDVYYHFLIPTETLERNNVYDVVIKFTPGDKSNLLDKTYKQYNIEFFSNCPSFVFTYAYVANLNGYFIKELAGKYEPETLKYPPTSRNPGNVFGYEKSIYFACRYLSNIDTQLLYKSHVEKIAQPVTKNTFKDIKTISVVLEEIKREKKVQKEEKKRKPYEKLGKKEKKLLDEKINKVSGNTKSNVNIVQKTKSTNKKVNKIKPVKKKR